MNVNTHLWVIVWNDSGNDDGWFLRDPNALSPGDEIVTGIYSESDEPLLKKAIGFMRDMHYKGVGLDFISTFMRPVEVISNGK